MKKKILFSSLLCGLSLLTGMAHAGLFSYEYTETREEWKSRKDPTFNKVSSSYYDEGEMRVEVECNATYDKYRFTVEVHKEGGGHSLKNESPWTPIGVNEVRSSTYDCTGLKITFKVKAYDTIGYLIGSQDHDHPNTAYRGAQYRIPVKDFAQALPRRPEKLVIAIFANNVEQLPQGVVMTGGKIDKMGLNGEKWLPPDILADTLIARIFSAIEKKKYEDALPSFKTLEELNQPLPENFYYYQIVALSGSGNKSEAKGKIVRYMEKYGKKGKYYDDVVKQLSSLN